MPKHGTRLSRVGVLAPAALSVCIDASIMAAPAAGAALSTVLKELSMAFMLKKWFHGVMTAQEADVLLMQKGKNGSYLVRESQTHPGEYVLSVRVRGRVRHVKIRRTNNKYDMGGEMFDDLADLIEHCRLYPVAETAGDDVFRLTQPVTDALTLARHTPRVPDPLQQACPPYSYYSEPKEKKEPSCPCEEYVPADQTCSRCQNHGTVNSIKDYHYLDCRWRYCVCAKCKSVASYNSAQKEDKFVDDKEVDEDGYEGLGLGAMVYDDEDTYEDEATALEPGVLEDCQPGFGFYGEFIGGGIRAEFRTLNQVERHNVFTSHHAHGSLNVYQNRYINVLPYDQTRVILPYYKVEQNGNRCFYSNYINASYIRPLNLFRDFMNKGTECEDHLLPLPPLSSAASVSSDVACQSDSDGIGSSDWVPPDYVKNKFYIATQGCTKRTIVTFWEMIMSEDIRVIAMLTRRVENGKTKCERYWPRVEEKVKYGDIEVIGVQEIRNPTYVIREFYVTSPIFEAVRVYQYQFLDWSDHSIPVDTKGIRVFLEDINERMLQVSKENNPPKQNVLCVHCSAGIGRTGTAIALDILINQVKLGGSDTHIDIHQVVKLLRTQRAGMVQNITQYMFLYFAMQDHLIEMVAKGNRTYRPTPPYD